jgi:hypothetical protein
VSCDTHCHTLTHSGHGDATLAERMVTIAGEGIELPIATDHNVTIDYEAAARAAQVRSHFTPVVGNEVTTPRMGHFNVFPIDAGASPIDSRAPDWQTLFRDIFQTPGVRVCILNHARDLHGGFRPFGPRQHLGAVGENLDGRRLEANAMEVVNSGALQTDPLQLYRDWFGMLNRGFVVAPVGSSDSHDVARHFVGQGRTYIRCDERDPGNLPVREACESLAAGRVLVSLGLLTEMTVDGRFQPGDFIAAERDIDVSLRVLGPSWTQADHVALYANGVKIREAKIEAAPADRPTGVKWEGRWTLPKPAYDVHLVAIATGPGVTELFWPIPKSYQPTSPDWKPYVLGSTGAIRIDADGSGRFDCAFDYAQRLVQEAPDDLAALVQKLAAYDEAVAAQAARLLQARGKSVADELQRAPLKQAPPHVRAGFEAFAADWRAHQIAQSQPEASK